MKVDFAHLKYSRTDTASDKISFENKSTQRLRAFLCLRNIYANNTVDQS